MKTKFYLLILWILCFNFIFLSAESLIPTNIEDFTYTYGNKDSDIVFVNIQGGPVDTFKKGLAKSFVGSIKVLPKVSSALFVDVHQIQTLRPDLFNKEIISFEQAKEYDRLSAQMIATTIKHFKKQGKTVYVLTFSFGAFLIQTVLAEYGNIADGYLILVGRLDLQKKVWKSLIEKGEPLMFKDGITPVRGTVEQIGMGGENEISTKNMQLLAAGAAYSKFTKLLKKVPLNNVVYISSVYDEQVGRLNKKEINFLKKKNALVILSEKDHRDTIDQFAIPGIHRLIAKTVPLDDLDGYIPEDRVDEYVKEEQKILDQNFFKINGKTYDFGSEGFISEEGINIYINLNTYSLNLTLKGEYIEREGEGIVEVEFAKLSPEDKSVIGKANFDSKQAQLSLTHDDEVIRIKHHFQLDSGEKVDLDFQFNVEIISYGNIDIKKEGNRLYLNGSLGMGSYLQLKEIFKKTKIKEIVLGDMPGSLNDQINVHLGKLIRKNKITTRVTPESWIRSGAVDLFASGYERIYEKGARIGVHSWCCAGEDDITADELPKDHYAHFNQIDYFTTMLGEKDGPDFYFFTLEAAPFDGIKEMTVEEIKKYNLATKIIE